MSDNPNPVTQNPVSKQQSNGGNGGDDGMKELERRVANLETNVQAIREDLHELKTDVAVINTHLEHISKKMATKADVSDVNNMAGKADLPEAKIDLTRWMIATLLGGIAVASGIVFGIMRVYPSQPPEREVVFGYTLWNSSFAVRNINFLFDPCKPNTI